MKTINALKRMIKEKISLTKFTAVATAFCFITSVIGSQTIYAAMPLPAASINISLDNIPKELIPFNLGRITDAYYANSNDIVINIQDLHSHEQTQRNISSILSILDSKFGISDVYMEGASETLNTEWLSGIKDNLKKQQVLNNLLNSGRLTGGEYFAVQSNKNITLKGLEDKNLYNQNFKRLNEILNKQTEVKNYISILNNIFNEKSKAYYSNNNKKLNRIVSNYKTGKIKTKKYIELLLEKAQKAEINLSKYPSIISFAKIVSKQNDFDSKKLSGEIQSILNELKETLTFNEYKILAEKASKKELEVEFYFELLQKAKQHNILTDSKYKNTSAFLEYLLLNQNFNTIQLANEEDLLIKELNNKFAETEQEKEIFFLKNFLDSLSHYLTNKITAKEYDTFIENTDTFKFLWAKYIDIDGIINIAEYFDLVEDFYKDNIERNKVFIRNLLGKTPKNNDNILRIKNSKINHKQKVIESLFNGKKIHIVITGGFHTDGFDKLLQDENINYLVITPNITESAANSDVLFQNFFNEQYDITNNTFANRPVSEIINLLNKGEIKDIRTDGNDVIIEYMSDEIFRLNQISQQPVNENILTEAQRNAAAEAFLKLQKLQQTIREQKDRAGIDLSNNKSFITQLADLEDAVNMLGNDKNVQDLKSAFAEQIEEIKAKNPEISSNMGKLLLPITRKIADILLTLTLFIPAIIKKAITGKDFEINTGFRNRVYSVFSLLENIIFAPLIIFKPHVFVLLHYNNEKIYDSTDENNRPIKISERDIMRNAYTALQEAEAAKEHLYMAKQNDENVYEYTSKYGEKFRGTNRELNNINISREKIEEEREIDANIEELQSFLTREGFIQRLDNTKAMVTNGLMIIGVVAVFHIIGSVTGMETYTGTISEYTRELFVFTKDNILNILAFYSGLFGIGYFGTHLTYNLKIDHQVSKAKSALKKDIRSLIDIFPNDIDLYNYEDLIKQDKNGNWIYPLGPVFYDILTAFPKDFFKKHFQNTVSGAVEILTILEILKDHAYRADETDEKSLKANIDTIVDWLENLPYKNKTKRRKRMTISKIIRDIDMILEKSALTREEKQLLKSLKGNLSEFKRPRFKLSIHEARLQEKEQMTTTVLQTATEGFKSVYTKAIDTLQQATYSFLFKDKTEYTIVANADDTEREALAESLAASGVKVNLILIGESGLIKETPSRIAHDGWVLAYGLLDDSVKNLKVYGYDKLNEREGLTQQDYLSALLNYITDSSKNTIKILDLPTNLSIDVTAVEEDAKEKFTTTGVGKNVYKLFFEAIEKKILPKKEYDGSDKIKTERVADMQIKPSLVASNISEEQVASFGADDIARLIEQGITTLIISINDNSSQTDLNNLLQTAHNNGLKVIFNYKMIIKEIDEATIEDKIKALNKMLTPFDIDGLQLDLSESGDYANDILAMNSISTFTKTINERKVGSFLAVKMPAEIRPSEYAQYFRINGTKTVLDYTSPYIFDISSHFNMENVIVNISADENGAVSPAQLTSIFEGNKVSMISLDQPILEAMDTEGFTFNGMTLTKFITSIFETTPQGQEMKGINKGRKFITDRDISLSDEVLKKLCDMYIADEFNFAEINNLLDSTFKENISKYELKGIVAGVIQMEELNKLNATDISFDKAEYSNLLMRSLLDYRIAAGTSFADVDTSKDAKEILAMEKFSVAIQSEIAKVQNILNGQADGNIDTIIAMLSSIKDNSALTKEDRTAVLEGLLLLLFSDARKPEADIRSMLGENLDIKKMHAILSAA